eukprot:SAG11_NODE_11577_length_751_cov_1.006135_1_plen_66_part_00
MLSPTYPCVHNTPAPKKHTHTQRICFRKKILRPVVESSRHAEQDGAVGSSVQYRERFTNYVDAHG